MKIMGDEIHGTKQNVVEIVKDNKQYINVIVEGEIRKLEQKGPFNNGNFLYDGSVYDGTHTIYFNLFTPKRVKLKKGKYVKIEGLVKKNNYKKTIHGQKGELVIEPKAIYELTKPVDKDTAEVKRVEFQTNTFMSEKNGAIPVKTLVKKASDMGMKAIAITDTSVVQGFPEAHFASKENNIKVIYGMQGKMIDYNSIVHNSKNQRIEDTNFVMFDVETTGFSTNHEYVIEFGASKFKIKYACTECEFEEEIGAWEKHTEDVHVCPTCKGYGKKKKKDDALETVKKQLVKIDDFNRLVRVDKPVSETIENLTGINDELLEKEGVTLEKALRDFIEYQEGGVLVAHNANFDMGHLEKAYERVGLSFEEKTFIDTMALSQVVNTKGFRSHKLNTIAKKEKVVNDEHHRATNDAIVTGKIMNAMLQKIEDKNIQTLDELNDLIDLDEHYKFQRSYTATILVKNKTGLKNLYKIVSESHTQYLSNLGKIKKDDFYPVIPWSLYEKYNEGLIIGTGSHLGKVFDVSLEKPMRQLREEVKRYDFVEIQPASIAQHYWNNDRPKMESEQDIVDAWKRVYQVAKEQGKFIIATGHAHYVGEDRAINHNMLIYSEAPPKRLKHEQRPGRIEYSQGPCHLRKTNEMIDEFTWLSDEETFSIVVDNTNKLNEEIEEISPIPDKLYTPNIKGVDVDEELRQLAFKTAKETYGNPLPKRIEDRLEKELESVIGNGYAVIYYVSHLLVKKSLEDGYLVGSRGSIGSSFAATMSGITEVNPLPPHYLCKECHWSLFIEQPEVLSGYDLPKSFKGLLSDDYSTKAKKEIIEIFQSEFNAKDSKQLIRAMLTHKEEMCPKCKQQSLKTEGQNIPFETFLGFKGDKVPDIDLNFSGVYQPKAHRFIQDMFGETQVYRAGTIKTVAERTAYAIAKRYLLNNGVECHHAEVERLASEIEGAKDSTGQHPGGMIVVPEGMEIEDFTPCQLPANKKDKEFKTTHFDFESVHDFVLKFDILGHEVPTNLRLMKDLTGLDPREIPMNDERVYKLWFDTEEAIGVHHKDFMAKTGTLGLPEMGTRVVQDMITETKPKKYGELLVLSGLSHGTDVYYNNAQGLIQDGTCGIREVIGCRDDIMRYLIDKGLEKSLAFTIMEHVRKGKGLSDEWEREMLKHDVPEWYIDSCNKIKYMFPRAHASAYVTDAIRMGYYKIYYPLEFYSAIFTAKYADQDLNEFRLSIEDTKKRIVEVDEEIKMYKKEGERSKETKAKKLKAALNLALEMKTRGFDFGSVRMYESHANSYLIDYDTNELIAPFSSIDGIGETVANNIFNARQDGIYKGIDDLKSRTGVDKNHIEALRELDCLKMLESKQFVLY